MVEMRCAKAINGFKSGASALFGAITDPWKRGFEYASQEGKNKSARGLLEAMYSSEQGEKALTNYHHTWKDKAGVEHSMDINGGKVAASVAGLAIGYRALSGGGVYRDKNGNTDVAGIPFV